MYFVREMRKKSTMSATIKRKVNKEEPIKIIVSNQIKNYKDDPIILDKIKRAKESLQKYGLPNKT